MRLDEWYKKRNELGRLGMPVECPFCLALIEPYSLGSHIAHEHLRAHGFWYCPYCSEPLRDFAGIAAHFVGLTPETLELHKQLGPLERLG